MVTDGGGDTAGGWRQWRLRVSWKQPGALGSGATRGRAMCAWPFRETRTSGRCRLLQMPRVDSQPCFDPHRPVQPISQEGRPRRTGDEQLANIRAVICNPSGEEAGPQPGVLGLLEGGWPRMAGRSGPRAGPLHPRREPAGGGPPTCSPCSPPRLLAGQPVTRQQLVLSSDKCLRSGPSSHANDRQHAAEAANGKKITSCKGID